MRNRDLSLIGAHAPIRGGADDQANRHAMALGYFLHRLRSVAHGRARSVFANHAKVDPAPPRGHPIHRPLRATGRCRPANSSPALDIRRHARQLGRVRLPCQHSPCTGSRHGAGATLELVVPRATPCITAGAGSLCGPCDQLAVSPTRSVSETRGVDDSSVRSKELKARSISVLRVAHLPRKGIAIY